MNFNRNVAHIPHDDGASDEGNGIKSPTHASPGALNVNHSLPQVVGCPFRPHDSGASDEKTDTRSPFWSDRCKKRLSQVVGFAIRPHDDGASDEENDIRSPYWSAKCRNLPWSGALNVLSCHRM